MNICPTCGSTIKLDIIVSLEDNAITYIGRTAKLSPTMAEILVVLVKTFPGVATHERLGEGVYGINPPESEYMTIAKIIQRVKERISPIGLDIESSYGHGYRLVKRDT